MGENELQPIEQEGQQELVTGEVVPRRPKRLLRSRRERVLFGVCGGVGQYFGIDPVLVRALWVLFTLVTGVFPGVVLYLIATLVVPENKGEEESAPGWRLPVQSNVLWGGLLVLAGLYFLLRSFRHTILPALPTPLRDVMNFSWNTVRGMALPAVLIGLGLLLIFGISLRRKSNGRRLTRSRESRLIAGVCGGLGEYFKIDPTWVRLLWVVLTLVSVGIGAVLYLVAMIAIPEQTESS